MQEIVPVHTSDTGSQYCDGRTFHEWLGVGRDFTTWVRDRIEQYGFEEDKDFSPVLGKSTGGRPSTEYHLTLDMAKALGMIENSERGREIRRYFIEVEKMVRKQALEAAEAQRLLDVRHLDGRIKALERIAPDYPTRGDFKRFTVMGAYEEHSRVWVKYRKNKDLEMAHGVVCGSPLTLIYLGQQPYARVDQAAVIVGLSTPQTKKLAQEGDMVEFEGVKYLITNRLPEPIVFT